MLTDSQNQKILKEELFSAITYIPIYKKMTGNANAGILLSFLLELFSSISSQENSFFYEDTEIMDRFHMSYKELKEAKQSINDKYFMDIQIKKEPGRTKYKIDWKEFWEQKTQAMIGEK